MTLGRWRVSVVVLFALLVCTATVQRHLAELDLDPNTDVQLEDNDGPDADQIIQSLNAIDDVTRPTIPTSGIVGRRIEPRTPVGLSFRVIDRSESRAPPLA